MKRGEIRYCPAVADFHSQRVQAQNRIGLLQRPVLPGLHFLHHRLGHGGDQRARYPHAVHFLQITLESSEAGLIHGDDLRFKNLCFDPADLRIDLTEIAF